MKVILFWEHWYRQNLKLNNEDTPSKQFGGLTCNLSWILNFLEEIYLFLAVFVATAGNQELRNLIGVHTDSKCLVSSVLMNFAVVQKKRMLFFLWRNSFRWRQIKRLSLQSYKIFSKIFLVVSYFSFIGARLSSMIQAFASKELAQSEFKTNHSFNRS